MGNGIRVGQGMEEALKMCEEMGRLKYVCPKCGSVFCLNCANAEGHRQRTGGSHCPRCGTQVA
jgi:ribosomal protein L37AE/L43A